MNFNTQEFNKEIKALRLLKKDQLLPALTKAQVKEQILNSLPAQEHPAPFSSLLKQRLLRYGAIVAAAATLSAGTVFASNQAGPGDALYPVKKLKEQVELSLAPTQAAKIKVQAKHANERILEIQKLDEQTSASSSLPAATVQLKKKIRIDAENQAKVELRQTINNLQQTQVELKDQGKQQEADELSHDLLDITNKAAAVNLLNGDDDSSRRGKNNLRGLLKDQRDQKHGSGTDQPDSND